MTDTNWGHRHNSKTGERRWGVAPLEFTIELAEVETIAPGMPARVENIGTKQNPILKFLIPAGRPGTDATLPKGFTGTVNGIDVTNGLVRSIDQSIVPLRNVCVEGQGVDVTYNLTPEGALSISIDATKLAERITTSISDKFEPRITSLETARSEEAFKQAVKMYTDRQAENYIEFSEMKSQYRQLKEAYQALRTLYLQAHPEMALPAL